jgi:hypothetical protein
MRMIPLTLLVSFVLLGSRPAGAQMYQRSGNPHNVS